jgi:uncharacterized small protein (DUF1192 family)
MTTSDDEEQRRERLRALQKMRDQVPAPRVAGAGAPSQGNNPRGAKLRELLERRQASNAQNPQQAGGGRLLQALAGRAGGGVGGNQGAGGGLLRMALANRGRSSADDAGGIATPSANPLRKDADPGNRAMILRRIMQARQNRSEGQPSQHDQQLSELQDRVHQLTEEVERLRAEKAAQETAKDKKKMPAQGKKADRSAPKTTNDKT